MTVQARNEGGRRYWAATPDHTRRVRGVRGARVQRRHDQGLARAAGLQSQALIYWYFPTKEALFRAVIEAQIPYLEDSSAGQALLDRPPEEVLPLLARGYLAIAHQPFASRVVRLLVPEVLRRPEVAELIGPLIEQRVLGFLRAYLDRQVALGRLRPHDTRTSARMFLGTFLVQGLGIIALPALRADGLGDDEHVESGVAIFLEGLRPR